MRKPSSITIKVPVKLYPFFLDMVDCYQSSYTQSEIKEIEGVQKDFLDFLSKDILKDKGTERLGG